MLIFRASRVGLRSSRHFSKERAGKGVRPGVAIVLDGIPHRVTKIMQGKRGKGGGFVRATLKNLSSSTSAQTFEKTFTSDETVEFADLEKEVVQYSWNDGNTYMFMNSQTFEEIPVPVDDVDAKDFLLEGQEVKLLKFRGAVIGVELPHICEYTVVSVDGSKAWGGNQPATLDTGTTIMVPMFVKEGIKIRVNVYEGSYVERVQ